MEERPDFKRGLFGLDPHKVSAYLRQMRNLQDKEFTDLQTEVLAQRELNAKLKKERDALLATQLDHAERLYLQELMMTRAGDVLQVMKQHTQQEIAGLERVLEQKREEHRRKIDGIESLTDHYNRVLHTMLQEFGQTMHKFTSSSFEVLEALPPELDSRASLVEQAQAYLEGQAQQPNEQLAGQELDNEEISLPESELSQGSQAQTQEPASASTPAPEQPPAKDLRHDKVIQFKVKAVTEKAAPLRNTPAAERVESQPQVLARQEMAAAPQVSPTRNVAGGTAEVSSSAFWGNIQPYVGNEVEAYDPSPLPTETEVWLTEDTPETEPTPTPLAQDTPVYEPEESKESEAVSTEIMSIRNRYIVGKVAGEDVHDVQGRLIVSKNATITPEMVDLAEKAGRLPDLIVNMKIAGVGDEKR